MEWWMIGVGVVFASFLLRWAIIACFPESKWAVWLELELSGMGRDGDGSCGGDGGGGD